MEDLLSKPALENIIEQANSQFIDTVYFINFSKEIDPRMVEDLIQSVMVVDSEEESKTDLNTQK